MSKEAIEHYEAALKEAFPSGATGDVFHHWNEARKALAEQPVQQEPVAWLYKSPMPDGSVFVGASVERLQIGIGVTPDSTEQPLYTSPPASKPLTDELNQIEKDLSFHGLTLVKTATGYAVLKLGQITAHAKENT